MKPKNKKITVKKPDAGQRLDVFLSAKLKISRSQAQKMIAAGQILVNEKLPKKAGDNLSAGASIVIARSKATKQSPKTTGLPRPAKAGLAMTVKIIAETPDYIVIEKPTGMLTHPTMAGEKNTLANFITKKYTEVKRVGDDPMRPGIVHRLDKEASGLMVVARTQKMFNHLKKQFKNRTVDKEYFALVHGKVARDWGEINFPITRSETADRMAARPLTERAENILPLQQTVRTQNLAPSQPVINEPSGEKEAKTEFWVEKKFTNFTLLKIKIHTGRMHQIRVHLLAYNHPLVGDPLYFQKKQKRTWDEKLGRLFLHSAKLGFTDLEGKTQEFESPLPNELDEFLTLLK